MDGAVLKQAMLDALDEPTESNIFETDARVLYQCLDAAAVSFVRQTRCLTSSATIETVEGQQAYDLPPDFINLYLKTPSDRHYIKYSDGSVTSFPVLAQYDQIFYDHQTDEKETPRRFAVIDRTTAPSLITGTATASGAKTGGQCTLNDKTKDFAGANLVYPRDTVHNTRDNSHGLILSVTDSNNVVTALFNGALNAWKLGDGYVIQRASTKQIYLDAPSSTSGHTITVPYVCMPGPVFSDYGFWRFPPVSCRAICYEAAFMHQNRMGDYVSADRHHILFQQEVSRIRAEDARRLLQSGRYRKNY